MTGAALAAEVTTAEPYVVPAVGERRFTVAALDLGIKAMTPTLLAEQGIEVHVLPATSTFEQISDARRRRGLLLQRPGRPGQRRARDHRAAPGARARGSRSSASASATSCSGRALGFGTYKLKYGHRGINQPVIDRTTGKVEVTAHNHGFAVDAPLEGEVTAPSDGALGTTYGRVRVSHVCLNDDVVEGLECLDLPAYSVQYHPEAAAGPHDAGYLFDRFVALMDRSTDSTDSTDATDQEGRA